MKIQIENPRATEFDEQAKEKLRNKLALSARLGATISLTQDESVYVLSLMTPAKEQS